MPILSFSKEFIQFVWKYELIKTWFKVQDHVKGLSVVGNLLVKSGQVKFVLNVVLINLYLKKIDENDY